MDIKNRVKKYLKIGGIVIAVLSLLLITGLSIALKYYKNEATRYKENYNATFDKSLEQNVTLSEFKEKYASIADTLKQYKIKPRQIERVVQFQYVYRDTGRREIQIIEIYTYIYDTVYISRVFEAHTGCFYISGEVTDSSVIITEQSLTDTLYVVLTKYRTCLFGQPVYRAVAISQCTGATLPVLNNIHVIKKRGKLRT